MKLKNRKRMAIVGIIIAIICCLIPFYMIFIKTESIIVTWMPTADGQEQINEYKEAGYCIGGYVAEDNSYAEIKLTEWQRRKWLDFLYGDVAGFLERANKIEHMNIYVSSDTKEMIVSADREVSFETLATYLGIIAWDIEMIQILNGEADWGFEFIVKDMETEKVLYTASCPEERVKIYESFWDEIEK